MAPPVHAMVDRADDLKVGVKSTAILFGDVDIFVIAGLQGLVFDRHGAFQERLGGVELAAPLEQQRQIVDRRLGQIRMRRKRSEEDMRYISEGAEPRLALGGIRQVDADVCIRAFDIRRATRQSDNFPLPSLE